MNIYLACAIVSILSMLLTQVIIVQKQKAKYKLANLQWEKGVYWKSDFVYQLIGSVITIGIGLVLLIFFLEQYPKVKTQPFYVASFFAFVGYTGADVATKFFSVINSRFNSAVDYKTNIADQTTGNLDSPTPATKP